MFKMAFLAALGFYCACAIFNLIGEFCRRMYEKLDKIEKKTKNEAQHPKEVKKTGRVVVSGFGREL